MKTLIRFNASAAKESSCLLRTWLTVIDGYTEAVPNNDIVFGQAVHEYVKVMRLTQGDFGQATRACVEVFNRPKKTKPKKEYLNERNFLIKTCMGLWDSLEESDFETLINPSTGQPLVELKFEIPYYSDEFCEVYLCGTIDDLCKHRSGCYAVRDYKTTSVWDSKDYLMGYALSPQLMFYRMAVEWHAAQYPDSIFAEMLSKGTLACFVEGIFLAGKDKEPVYLSSEKYQFTDDKMAEFRSLLDQQIKRLVTHVSAKCKPQREGMLNGACQTVYGKCKFFHVCNALDDVHARHLLNNNFVCKPYDPLNYET